MKNAPRRAPGRAKSLKRHEEFAESSPGEPGSGVPSLFDPKWACTEPKWDPQKAPKGTQATPNKTNRETNKQKKKRTPTNQHTHAQTQQLNNRTIQMKRLVGMREAFEQFFFYITTAGFQTKG